jgi:hypothetical protein
MTQRAEKHANFLEDGLNSARLGGNQQVLMLKTSVLKKEICRFLYILHESYLDE